jgi:hypothetical protein
VCYSVGGGKVPSLRGGFDLTQHGRLTHERQSIKAVFEIEAVPENSSRYSTGRLVTFRIHPSRHPSVGG